MEKLKSILFSSRNAKGSWFKANKSPKIQGNNDRGNSASQRKIIIDEGARKLSQMEVQFYLRVLFYRR